MILVHGTTVAVAGRGVLIRGASGRGKSDLALRLI
ncbi:MAG: HPr Serine kinase C-terminal domain, partial [Pseudomonadota bacterium]